jgi:hypothetical protein
VTDPRGQEDDGDRCEADRRHGPCVEHTTGVRRQLHRFVDGLEYRRADRQREHAIQHRAAAPAIELADQQAHSEEAAIVCEKQFFDQWRVERQLIGEGDAEPDQDDGIDPARE